MKVVILHYRAIFVLDVTLSIVFYSMQKPKHFLSFYSLCLFEQDSSLY